MEQDLVREINKYFEINNANITAINKTIMVMQENISDLVSVLADVKSRLELMEKTHKVMKMSN